MKLTIFLICVSVMGSLAVDAYSQSTKLTVEMKNSSLKDILAQIENQSEFRFFYSGNVNVEQKASVSLKDKKVFDILDELFDGTGIKYEVYGRQIALLSVGETSTFSVQQQKSVSGKVTGTSGEPLPGVTVVVKGTTTGTITNADGIYSLLNLRENAVLIFSFVGMKGQEIAVGNKTTIDVKLEEESIGIDEVVAIGYGTQRVTKVSGAISTIRMAEVQRQKPIRAEEALQGTAAGVNVYQNGSPGKAPTILIRGIPSFTGTNPVVIVDGIPGSLETLNSSDIESISVLKDAASTAIYGVKGGNGVIVVTTKSGDKNQKTRFSFSTNYGQQAVMKKVDVLNATEYATIINEGQVNAGLPLLFSNVESLGEGTDWQDQIFYKAPISSHNFDVRGGSENVTYFLSLGYLDQAGIVGGDDKNNYKRATITANLTFQLIKNLKLIVNTNYVNVKSRAVQEGSFNAIIGSALNFDPTVPLLNADPVIVGKFGFSNLILSEIYNPAYKLYNTWNRNNTDKISGKAEIQYDIIKNLKLTSRFGYSKSDGVGKGFSPLVFYGTKNIENTMNADGTTVSGKHNSVSESSSSYFGFTYETFANYNYSLNDLHHFDAVLGYSLSKSTGYGFSASRQDVPFNSWAFADISSATGVNSATNTNAASGSSSQNLTRRNLSYFGRMNYDYMNKYLASFSARRDGSIAFGPKNKFGNFFAGSLGWVVTAENFMKNIKQISYLKIRGSYGSIGNENVSPQYVAVVTGGPSYATIANSNGYNFSATPGTSGTFYAGSTIGSYLNETLRWEKQIQSNIGFDIYLLKNKITISADYFAKAVDGLLFTDPAPLYAGTSAGVASNIGNTKTNGFDFTLGYNDESAKGLKFRTSINFTTAKNKVTATNLDGTAFYQGGQYYNGTTYYATRFEKGQSPGYFYGFKTDGLFQNTAEITGSPTQANVVPGDIRFVDVNKDGKITDLDKTKIGDPFPAFTIGWNLGLEYKNIEFSILTYLSQGNDAFRVYERNATYTNKFAGILDRWTGEGTTNDGRNPRYTASDKNNNWRVSDRFVEDASFIKIKSVILGYTVPSSLFHQKIFNEIRIYAQAKNLFTFTKYSGYDPEISGGIMETGMDRGAYPQARTFSAGLDLKF